VVLPVLTTTKKNQLICDNYNSDLGFIDSVPNAVLCKSCSVLPCVLEQPRVDNSSDGSSKRGSQLGTIGPIGLRPPLVPINWHTLFHYCNCHRSIGSFLLSLIQVTPRVSMVTTSRVPTVQSVPVDGNQRRP
jgi:hypothetical protein